MFFAVSGWQQGDSWAFTTPLLSVGVFVQLLLGSCWVGGVTGGGCGFCTCIWWLPVFVVLLVVDSTFGIVVVAVGSFTLGLGVFLLVVETTFAVAEVAVGSFTPGFGVLFLVVNATFVLAVVVIGHFCCVFRYFRAMECSLGV